MTTYRYEVVDRDQGVVHRWDRDHASDEHALGYLKGVTLLADEESARAFRPGEEGPFATFEPDFGVEVLT